MIYSRWQPGGGYEYYETPEKPHLGNDLPDPAIPPPEHDIGTPAQECGRALPAGARFVGRGVTPQGMITPAMKPGIAGMPMRRPLGDTTATVAESVQNVLWSGLFGFLIGRYIVGWK